MISKGNNLVYMYVHVLWCNYQKVPQNSYFSILNQLWNSISSLRTIFMSSPSCPIQIHLFWSDSEIISHNSLGCKISQLHQLIGKLKPWNGSEYETMLWVQKSGVWINSVRLIIWNYNYITESTEISSLLKCKTFLMRLLR